MAEEKKKKNTTTNKTNNAKKTTTNKKVNNKNNKKKPIKKQTTQATKQQQKKQVKKVTPKKDETKKVAPKKVEETKSKKVTLTAEASSIANPDPTPVEIPVVTDEIEKVIEVEVDANEEESILEKTLIFDGRENQNLAEVVEKLEEENVVLEDKVIKRSKVRKIAVMVLSALIAITIIGTIIFVAYSEYERINNSKTLNSNIFDKVSNKYDSVDDIDTEKKTEHEIGKEDYEYIESITLGEFEKKVLTNEDMIVMVTSSTCLFCVEYEPIVDEVFKDLDGIIYRINITSLSNEEIERFRSYYAFKITPSIFTLKDGIVKKELVGKQTKDTLTNWIKKNK